MSKYIFLVRGKQDESYESFTQRVLGKGRSMALLYRPGTLKITLTAHPPPAISIIPFRKSMVAAISMTDPVGKFIDFIKDIRGISGGYLVDEALPVAYTKDWADGKPTPGVCLLTLFRQKNGISYETFIDRWHNSHTPLSLKIHPLWNYNRNVVTENILDHSQSWNGIVEEHFRTSGDLLNPFRFFGKPWVIAKNMLDVYTDTKSFLEYKTIEPYLAVEYHLVSAKEETPDKA